MQDLVLLFSLQKKIVKNTFRTFLQEHSKLKTYVVSIFAIIFWLAIFVIFYRGFAFFSKHIPKAFFGIIIDYIFSVFYCALFMMLSFSSLIIAFSSFFQNKEAKYLMTRPIAPENLFLYKFVETFLFASWAVFFLGIPWALSFGFQQGVSWQFYPLLIISFVPYIIIPCAVGAFICFLVTLYISRFRKITGIIFLGAMTIAIVLLIASIVSLRKDTPSYTLAWLYGLLGYLDFTKYKFLPSLWMANAMMAAAQRDYAEFFFQFALLLSTALFSVCVCYWLAALKYNLAWSRAHSSISKKNIWKLSFLKNFLKIFFFLKPRARLFLEKDIKIFIRDPVQWTQFAILLGLLLLYILNLRTLKYDQQSMFWKSIIATLNLSATALTVCTFSSRFIFPMLSLEGKRFWTLGVMPIKRSSILAAKFTFAIANLTLISLLLVTLSCYMLRLSWSLTLFHIWIVMLIVFGVAGLSVGLGAIYPNFNEDSPSKIVSGFGGTLNLVLNLAFVFFMIVLQIIPSHWILEKAQNVTLVGILFIASILLTLVTCIVPMWLGTREFDSIEI